MKLTIDNKVDQAEALCIDILKNNIANYMDKSVCLGVLMQDDRLIVFKNACLNENNDFGAKECEAVRKHTPAIDSAQKASELKSGKEVLQKDLIAIWSAQALNKSNLKGLSPKLVDVSNRKEFDSIQKKSIDKASRAKSDLRNAAVSEEAFFIDNEKYISYKNMDCDKKLPGFKLSDNIEIEMSATGDNYTGKSWHKDYSDVVFTWDSVKGISQQK